MHAGREEMWVDAYKHDRVHRCMRVHVDDRGCAGVCANVGGCACVCECTCVDRGRGVRTCAMNGDSMRRTAWMGGSSGTGMCTDGVACMCASGSTRV